MVKTIAYIGDTHTSDSINGITDLTADLNQIATQSPTGVVDLIVFTGDNQLISDTQIAIAASNLSPTTPILYVVGNQNLKNITDLNAIKATKDVQTIPLAINPGPTGCARSSFSYDMGDTHIVQLNEYWNGLTVGGCAAPWFVPVGGANNLDGCFKYSTTDGGYIPDLLYTWLEADLTASTKPYKIVIGHEPLYADPANLGYSLDKDVVNRDKLQALLISKGVSTFIGGHTHKEGILQVGGIYHVNTGSAGSNAIITSRPSSIVYTQDTPAGLVITLKSENPTWSTPLTTTYTVNPLTPAKYKCVNDGITNTCTRDDLLGTYLEPTCGGICAPATSKYLCINGACVQDDLLGIYLEPTCGGTCTTVPKYACTLGVCTRDDILGTYLEPTCGGICTTVIPKYACTLGVCTRDDLLGTYLEPTCGGLCTAATPKYMCVNGMCIRDDLLGTFLESTCGGTCIATTPMYKCVNSVCTRDDLLGTYLEPTCGGMCTTPSDGCNCNCNCNCGGNEETPIQEPTILDNTLVPQKRKVYGMTMSVYDAIMPAIGCTDPLTCTKNVVIWKDNPDNPLGMDMGDTTLAKTAWSESMTKIPGDDGEYTFYNDTNSAVTIAGMPSAITTTSSSSSFLVKGLAVAGAFGIAAYAVNKLKKKPSQG